jgi:hypothetical protein
MIQQCRPTSVLQRSFQFFPSCFDEARELARIAKSIELSILSQLLPDLQPPPQAVAMAQAFNSFPAASLIATSHTASMMDALSILSQLLRRGTASGSARPRRSRLSILSQLLPHLCIHRKDYAKAIFQFFPSCFLNERAHMQGGEHEAFQFFPSCFCMASRLATSRRERSFNSFPAASRCTNTWWGCAHSCLSILSQLLPEL